MSERVIKKNYTSLLVHRKLNGLYNAAIAVFSTSSKDTLKAFPLDKARLLSQMCFSYLCAHCAVNIPSTTETHEIHLTVTDISPVTP